MKSLGKLLSGNLTISDFRKVWLEEETDPPAFTEGKDKEKKILQVKVSKGKRKRKKKEEEETAESSEETSSDEEEQEQI